MEKIMFREEIESSKNLQDKLIELRGYL